VIQTKKKKYNKIFSFINLFIYLFIRIKNKNKL